MKLIVMVVTATISFGNLATAAVDKNWDRYFAIKRIGTQLAIKQNLLGGPPGNLLICDTWSTNFGTDTFSSQIDQKLLDVAGAVVEWKHRLSKVAKQEVWRAQLEAAEERMVRTVVSKGRDADIDGEGKKLVRALNKQIGSSKIEWSSECGAGGPIDVVFKTEPEKGRVTLISEFNYELCKVRGTQDDPVRCTEWRVAKEPESVTGFYYIRVEWPGRVEKPARYDLTTLSGKAKGPTVYWLRFP